MEEEFARAEARRQAARRADAATRTRRLAEEERGRRIAHAAEREREEKRAMQAQVEEARRVREAEELNETGGVRFSETLRAVPLATSESWETDRVRLPSRVLETLERQGALDSGPLTFELALMHDGQVLSTTHTGVAEFTAEEGTVVVPMKTALSLAKGRALDVALASIRVRFVRISRFAKTRARVQPLGEGFFSNGKETLDLDLKALMEHTLQRQIVLSQGDIIPLRYLGATYMLKVHELAPEQTVVLLDTDLEIDLMPAESVTREAERVERMDRLRADRVHRAQALALALPEEPAPGMTIVTIRARLPGGTMESRRFLRDVHTVGMVLNWAASRLGSVLPSPEWAEEQDPALEMVQSAFPGQAPKVFNEASVTLAAAGLTQRVETVNIRFGAEPLSTGVAAIAGDPMQDVIIVQEDENEEQQQLVESSWMEAARTAEAALDEEQQSTFAASPIPTSSPMINHNGDKSEQQHQDWTVTEMFRHLAALGAPRAEAASLANEYLAALNALKRMDLLSSPVLVRRALELVRRFKGSVARIADAMLAEQQQSSSLSHCAFCGKSGDLMQCTGCHAVAYCNAGCQRLHWSTQHKTQCAMLRSASTPSPASMSDDEHDWSSQLSTLEGMGFLEPPHNRALVVSLLERNAGNVERVVSELLSIGSSS